MFEETWETAVIHHRQRKQDSIVYHAKDHAKENGCQHYGRHYPENVQVVRLTPISH